MTTFLGMLNVDLITFLFIGGLWELFHIVSIGSGLTTNQLYGFHQGYIINQHEVVGKLFHNET